MSISNAYCKKHDEIEPENHDELWACPQCSKENMKKFSIRDENGKTKLDRVLDDMLKEEAFKLAEESAYNSRR